MDIHFTFITKILGETLLTKFPVELPSTEHISIETSRLVPLTATGGHLGLWNQDGLCLK